MRRNAQLSYILSLFVFAILFFVYYFSTENQYFNVHFLLVSMLALLVSIAFNNVSYLTPGQKGSSKVDLGGVVILLTNPLYSFLYELVLVLFDYPKRKHEPDIGRKLMYNFSSLFLLRLLGNAIFYSIVDRDDIFKWNLSFFLAISVVSLVFTYTSRLSLFFALYLVGMMKTFDEFKSFFFKLDDFVFSTISHMLLLYFYVHALYPHMLIPIWLLYLANANIKAKKNALDAKMIADALNEQNEQLLAEFQQNVSSVDEFSVKLRDHVETIKQSSITAKEMYSVTETTLLEEQKAIAHMASDMANGFTRIQQVSDVTDEMKRKVADNKHDVSFGMEQLRSYQNEVNTVNERMTKNVATILELQESSHEIKQILDVINSITAKTSLLSINASIEAAHAGAFGAGFLVVAEEVKLLSKRSIDSANDIQRIIERISKQIQSVFLDSNASLSATEKSSIVFNDLFDVFLRIDENSSNLQEQSLSIVDAVTPLQDAITNVLMNIKLIEASMDENHLSIDEVKKIISSQSEHLTTIVEQFDVLHNMMKKIS